MLTTDQNRRARFILKCKIAPDHQDSRALHMKMSEDHFFYPRLAIWLANRGQTSHLPYFIAQLVRTGSPQMRKTAAQLISVLSVKELITAISLLKADQKNIPRMIKTAVATYLKKLEASPAAYDKIMLRERDALKTLYAGLHLRPDPRTDAILFKDKPPAGSMATGLIELARSTDKRRQIELLEQFDFPLESIQKNIDMCQAIGETIVNKMDPESIAKNLDQLSAMGILVFPEVLQKVRQALKNRARAVRQQGDIKRTTALVVAGQSTTETTALTGQRLAALISPHASCFRVFWCSKNLKEIKTSHLDLTAWAEAFSEISISSRPREPRLDFMENLEQLILIHGNNPASSVVRDIFRTAALMPVPPTIVLVPVARQCYKDIARAFMLHTQTVEFKGDYDVLSRLSASLEGPSIVTMLEQIEQIELPSPSDSIIMD